MAGSRRPARRVTPPAARTVVAVAVGLTALVVYRLTMLQGVGAWDTAEAQTVPPLLGTMHPTGFPAYVVLGFVATRILAPLGSPAFAMNLLSAILLALTAALAVLVYRRLGAPSLVAGLLALGFALTPVPWAIAVSADAHALHVALVAGVTYGLLRWESRVRAARRDPGDAALGRRADRAILATAALFGVTVANHGLSMLLAPAIALFVLAVDWRVLLRPRLVAAAIATVLAVAAVLYLELPLRAGPFRAPLVYGSPGTWSGFWDIVLARQFQADVTGGDVGTKLAALLDLARQQLGPLAIVVPVAFVVTAWRHPRYALYSGVAVVLVCAFAANYENARIERYYLGPLFFAWSWIAAFAGVIAERILGRREDVPSAAAESTAIRRAELAEPAGARDRGAIPVAWRPDPTRVVASLVVGLALLVPTAIDLRDRWSATDQSSTTWATTWLDDAFASMAPDAVVISWWSYSTPMWYGQLVEGRRPDIWIVDDRTRLDEHLGDVPDVIEANLGTRPVYVIRLQDSDVQALRDRYTIEPVGRPGNLFRVTGRTESTP